MPRRSFIHQSEPGAAAVERPPPAPAMPATGELGAVMTGSVSVKAGGGLASEGTAMGGGLRLVAGCSCTARRRPAAPCRLSRRRAGPWP